MAYQILENNDNPQDYQDFLEKYPNSEHADEVRQRLTKLEEMLAKWNTIALSDNVNDFINFKNTYSDIQYGRLCDIKIDSLDFIIAQKQGTPEAYQHYLDSHLTDAMPLKHLSHKALCAIKRLMNKIANKFAASLRNSSMALHHLTTIVFALTLLLLWTSSLSIAT